MINTYKYRGETWIDIDHGTTEEIHDLMNTYNLHPFVAKELTSTTPKPRVEFHDQYIYCILHFPVWKHTHSKDGAQEIDFIIGKDFLITARYDTIDALHRFGKSLEVSEILQKDSLKSDHSLFILTAMLKHLYSSIFDELDFMEDNIEQITSKIFKEKEKEMVISISEMTRTLLNFRKVNDMHHEILELISKYGKDFMGEKFSKEMDFIISDYQKINTSIKSSLDRLRELRDTNNSLLTTKQNETVKHLTVMGFIILPLNLIAWIFAMRVEGLPFLDNPNGFWIVLVIMITSALVTLTYAKHKKWL